jgi:hypothetical protein
MLERRARAKSMMNFAKGRNLLRSLAVSLLVTTVTLGVLEIVLRVADFRELREGVSERSLSYRYDRELGWMPIPNSNSLVTNARTIHARHNSLGLRDDEFTLDAKPTIMFLGDSFVWGLDAEAAERFSDLLKAGIAGYKILAAGVSGYGTDQEYLLLRRLWPKVRPAVVVLIFCTQNDRDDNSTNIRYEGYQKPYFATAPDGSLVLEGQPVPKSRLQYIKEDWWVRHSWSTRCVSSWKRTEPNSSSAFNPPMRHLSGIFRPNKSRSSPSTALISIAALRLAVTGRRKDTSSSQRDFWACCQRTMRSRQIPARRIDRAAPALDCGRRFPMRSIACVEHLGERRKSDAGRISRRRTNLRETE